jgi:hypothetical protein
MCIVREKLTVYNSKKTASHIYLQPNNKRIFINFKNAILLCRGIIDSFRFFPSIYTRHVHYYNAPPPPTTPHPLTIVHIHTIQIIFDSLLCLIIIIENEKKRNDEEKKTRA